VLKLKREQWFTPSLRKVSVKELIFEPDRVLALENPALIMTEISYSG